MVGSRLKRWPIGVIGRRGLNARRCDDGGPGQKAAPATQDATRPVIIHVCVCHRRRLPYLFICKKTKKIFKLSPNIFFFNQFKRRPRFDVAGLARNAQKSLEAILIKPSFDFSVEICFFFH
jgi:hypothetical protein